MILHYKGSNPSYPIEVYLNSHYLGSIKNNGFYADSSRVHLSAQQLDEIAKKIKELETITWSK